MEGYTNKLRAMVDALTVVGEKFSQSDINLTVISGLGMGYEQL